MEGFSKEGIDGRICLRNSGSQWEGALWGALSQMGERMDQALLHLVIYIFKDASSQAQRFVPRTQVNEAIQCHSSDHGQTYSGESPSAVAINLCDLGQAI